MNWRTANQTPYWKREALIATVFHGKAHRYFMGALLIVLMLSNKAGFSQELNWTHHSTVKGVECSYAISACENESIVYLKFKNTNAMSVGVAWGEEYSTSNGDIKSGNKKTYILSVGEIFETDCSNAIHPILIVVDAGENDVIETFNFVDIQVSIPGEN
jgi:hypothetical protein